MEKILKNKIFYIILFIVLAIYVCISTFLPRHSKYSKDEKVFIGTIEDIKVKDDKISLKLKGIEELICNYYRDNITLEMLKEYPLGSKVEIEGSLKTPIENTIPNTFNYKEYLYNHGIFYTCTVSNIKMLNKPKNLLYKIKNFIINRINSFETRDYLSTMIVGDKSFLDEETLENYQNNGVVHLFAISGMHIGLFSTTLLFFFKKIRLKEKNSYIITILFLWFYAFLTGFSGSVLRASLLFTILSLNKIFKLSLTIKKSLLLTGAIILIVNPFMIYDIGFLFSFTTTFGLISSSEILKKHKLLGTSLVASLYSLPITVNNFYKFNFGSILYNIIFVPFVSGLVYPMCLLSFIIRPFESILKVLISILEHLNTKCSNIKLPIIVIPKMPLILIIIYYIILFTMLKRKFYLVSIFLFSLVLLTKLTPFLETNSNVEFLDVGQGDSCLIRSNHNKEVTLIDTGGLVSYKENNKTYYVASNTANYLHSLGISKINTIIITHGDYDHMGDAIYLLENFKVGKVIFNCGEYNNLENELIKILDKRNIKYYSCINELDTDNNKLYFLNTKEYDNENDNSNIIYTEFSDIKFLFMGDASAITEKEILNNYKLSNIDVLKVGHHGSKTSSSEEFINTINPKYSLISVGKNNRYGHPNKEVLENLENSKIYRTDIDGSVRFEINNKNLKIKTCPP